jgi:hypothetical protein
MIGWVFPIDDVFGEDEFGATRSFKIGMAAMPLNVSCMWEMFASLSLDFALLG